MTSRAMVCLRRVDAVNPELAATWFVGAGFLAATPGNGCYAVPLIALMAMSVRWHWLPVAFGPSVVYLHGPLFAQQHQGDSFMYLVLALVSLAPWRWAGPGVVASGDREVEPDAEGAPV